MEGVDQLVYVRPIPRYFLLFDEFVSLKIIFLVVLFLQLELWEDRAVYLGDKKCFSWLDIATFFFFSFIGYDISFLFSAVVHNWVSERYQV